MDNYQCQRAAWAQGWFPQGVVALKGSSHLLYTRGKETEQPDSQLQPMILLPHLTWRAGGRGRGPLQKPRSLGAECRSVQYRGLQSKGKQIFKEKLRN